MLRPRNGASKGLSVDVAFDKGLVFLLLHLTMDERIFWRGNAAADENNVRNITR